jgi:hypothetical protein
MSTREKPNAPDDLLGPFFLPRFIRLLVGFAFVPVAREQQGPLLETGTFSPTVALGQGESRHQVE